MYLFRLKNGKLKLAYGVSPQAALETLSLRLSAEEMAQILRHDYVRINQRELPRYVHLLG